MRSLIVVLLGAALASAQTAPEFEAASLKAMAPAIVDPAQPSTVMGGLQITRGGPGTSMPGRIRYANVTLMTLLLKAYDLESDQIVGPGWLIQDRYALDAVLPSGATLEQFRQMLQKLIVERFKLAMQWEERDLKVYRLVAANGGAKLKASAISSGGPDDDDPAVALTANYSEVDSRGCPVLPLTRRAAFGRNGCMSYAGWTMSEFAKLSLGMAIKNETGGSRWAHVIDETGLSGRFDFSLAYDIGYHAMLNSPMPESMREHVTSKNPVSIFKAVDAQLGLKLEPSTAKLRVMVIQKVERRPEEN